MRPSAVILVCLACLLASIPALAAPPAVVSAPAPGVAAAPQLDAPAAAAPLPAWLAPAGTPPVATPALPSSGTAKPVFVAACTIQFCRICEGCCRVSGGCVCC